MAAADHALHTRERLTTEGPDGYARPYTEELGAIKRGFAPEKRQSDRASLKMINRSSAGKAVAAFVVAPLLFPLLPLLGLVADWGVFGSSLSG